MSTAQRRGWKQSKFASHQQLDTKTSKPQPVVVKFDEPLNNVVEVEISYETVVEEEVVLTTVDLVEEEKVELPKIVKKNKKSE